MHPVAWILLSMVFFAGGEILSKIWASSSTRGPGLVLAAIGVYSIGSLLWFPAIGQKNHLTSLGTFWNICAMAVTILIGMVVFRESVSVRQVVGIVVAGIACVLLSK